MRNDAKTSMVLAGLTVLFLGLQQVFLQPSWNVHRSPPEPVLIDPAVIQTATVRLSAAERMAKGEVEEFDCYACHEEGKELTLDFGPDQQVIVPEEHNDIVLHHGGSNRNSNCFNCHNPKKLNELRTRDGHALTFAEGSKLCASCHGPTYRDWEIGIHGRITGYWDRSKGPTERKECTSCHDPHSPAFPALVPAPGPDRLTPSPDQSHGDARHSQ